MLELDRVQGLQNRGLRFLPTRRKGMVRGGRFGFPKNQNKDHIIVNNLNNYIDLIISLVKATSDFICSKTVNQYPV